MINKKYLEDYPKLGKWLDDNAETVADSCHLPWIVVGADDVKDQLLHMQAESDGRIAELEEENKLLKRVEQIFNDSPDLTFDGCQGLFKDEFEAHNLEQRINCVEHSVKLLSKWGSARVILDDYRSQLQKQLKALKEQRHTSSEGDFWSGLEEELKEQVND